MWASSANPREFIQRGSEDKGKRLVELSITHKLGAHDEPQFNIGEPRHSTPHEGVTRRAVLGTCQVASQPSNLRQVQAKSCRTFVGCAVLDEPVQHAAQLRPHCANHLEAGRLNFRKSRMISAAISTVFKELEVLIVLWHI